VTNFSDNFVLQYVLYLLIFCPTLFLYFHQCLIGA